MALSGNLRDFTVTQLLNLVNLASKTGMLVIEGPNETAEISFRGGKLAYATMGRENGSLASVLYKGKKISASQFRSIQKRAGHVSDKELGLLLINAGYLTQEDILLTLQENFVDIVHQLFTWAEGFFRFENDKLHNDRINVRLELENLIIEGSRQLREWEQLKDEIPSLEMALKFADRPGADLKNVNLSVEEWRVVSYISPKNKISQIAKTTKMDDMEIRRIVYGLIQAGLVELTRVEGVKPKLAENMFPTQDKEEQKSLVNRLIKRISNI